MAGTFIGFCLSGNGMWVRRDIYGTNGEKPEVGGWGGRGRNFIFIMGICYVLKKSCCEYNQLDLNYCTLIRPPICFSKEGEGGGGGGDYIYGHRLCFNP